MFCTRAPFRRLPCPSLSGSLRSACHVITGLHLRISSVLRILSVLNSIFFLGVALEKVRPRMRNSSINLLVSTSFTLGYILWPFHSSPIMWFLSFGGVDNNLVTGSSSSNSDSGFSLYLDFHIDSFHILIHNIRTLNKASPKQMNSSLKIPEIQVVFFTEGERYKLWWYEYSHRPIGSSTIRSYGLVGGSLS